MVAEEQLGDGTIRLDSICNRERTSPEFEINFPVGSRRNATEVQ